MLVPIWSYKHGWGKTSFLASLAYKISQKTNIKIILIDSNYIFNELENIMNIKGIVTLDSIISSIRDNISILDSAINIKKTNIDILCSSKIHSYNSLEKLMLRDKTLFKKFIYFLRNSYDLILWDLNSGFNTEITKFIIKEEADLVINILKQYKQPLIEMERIFNAYNTSKTIYVINEYNEYLGFDYKAIKSLLNKREKNKIFTLPYTWEIIEAINTKKISDFINKRGAYINQIDKIANELLENLNISIDKKNQKNIFSLFNFRLCKLKMKN